MKTTKQADIPRSRNSDMCLLCWISDMCLLCWISDFRLEVDEICALVGHHTAYNVKSLPTFRHNVSVPSSRIKKSKKKFLLGFL